MYCCDIAVLVLLKSHALYEICILKTNLVAREQSEILLRRLLHEVLSLYIQILAECYLSASELLVLLIVLDIEVLNLILRIVVDDKLYRINNCHVSLGCELQVVSHAILKHSVINRRLALGYSNQLHELLNS